MQGLNKDGGISFKRKKNFSDKKEEPEMFSRKAPKPSDEEPEEEIIEEPKVDSEYEARQKRLSKKHKQARNINYSGFAVNGSSILILLYGIQNIMLNPDTIEFINLIETTLGITINYEKFANLVDIWKTHIISMCGSIQLFFGYYQQTRRRMKEMDREDLFGFVNDELGKII